MSLKQKLIEFLTDNAETLRKIYSEFSDQKPSTIRGRLNENVGKIFRRIGRGVYLATQGPPRAYDNFPHKTNPYFLATLLFV